MAIQYFYCESFLIILKPYNVLNLMHILSILNNGVPKEKNKIFSLEFISLPKLFGIKDHLFLADI